MKKNAKEHEYYLYPDEQHFNDLINELATNTNRYGYGSCSYRVANGMKKYNVDIICPCDCRNVNVDEFRMCYYGLFLNERIKKQSISVEVNPKAQTTGNNRCALYHRRNKTENNRIYYLSKILKENTAYKSMENIISVYISTQASYLHKFVLFVKQRMLILNNLYSENRSNYDTYRHT